MKLDEIISEFDKREVHEIEIEAPPARVFDAVWKLDLSKSTVARLLFRLRGMPREACTLEGLIELGFSVLENDPPTELVLGLTAKFWASKPELEKHDSKSFIEFDEPGCGKAAWNFIIEPISDDRSRLRTETRVKSTDKKGRRLFSIYWFVIRPFSGWLRVKMLKSIKEEAETN